MAIGVIRPPRRGTALAPSYPLQSARPPARDWSAIRGPLYWRGKCDLAGGFPGFAQYGGLVTKARVQITASYFLVEEGRACGFGLPLQNITSAFVIDLRDRGDSLVRVQYVDAELVRTFTVRFCGARAALRPGHYARQLLLAIQATGTTQVLTNHALPEPELLVPWSAAHQFQHEPVHWHDRALAPIILGESLRLSDVWLTDASLIWGCGSGMGINRLPLSMMTDVIPAHVEDRAGTPAVYVGFADDAGRRHEVPFLFNRAATTAENEQHEIAMLNALRAHGIPLGAANGRLQPWRIDFPTPSSLVAQAVTPESVATGERPEPAPRPLPLAVPPEPRAEVDRAPVEEGLSAAPAAVEFKTAAPVDTEADLSANGHAPESAANLEPVGAIAETSDIDLSRPTLVNPESAAVVVEPSAELDEPIAESDESVASEAPHEAKAAVGADDNAQVPEPDVIGASEFPRFRQIEAVAMANLAEILREIDDRLTGKPLTGAGPSGPSPADQSLAYHELADAAIAGQLTWEEVRQRRARLTAMIDATPRLRTLLELHNSGHLDDAVLQRKRQEVKDELSSLVMTR